MSRRSIVPLSLALLLIAGSLAGCKSKAKQEADAAGKLASGEQAAAQIREKYQRLNPKNRVGVVVAVRSESNLAAVGDIPIQDFGVGDVVTFIHANEEPFNSGVVVNATADALHVRYESGKREPKVGDLVVRLQ